MQGQPIAILCITNKTPTAVLRCALPCDVLLCCCRTEPQWGTQQAVHGPDEAFDLANVQPGCTLRCEVSLDADVADCVVATSTLMAVVHKPGSAQHPLCVS